MYGIVYKITNKVNGKVYIGQTVQSLKDRVGTHRSGALNYQKTGKQKTAFKEAILKYGWDAFEAKQIARASSREELDRLEILCIRLFKSLVTQKGYNIESGGSLGHADTMERVGRSNGRPIFANGIEYP